jgi:adenylate kinase
MIFVVLMGGPGAGKGTQARLLTEKLDLPQISTGDLFRENLSKKTELGSLAQTYMDAGELVPDEVTVAMVKERLKRSDCSDGALFDGFPRNISQAKALDSILAELDSRVLVVPYVHVDPDVLLSRLAGRWTCKANGHVFHILFNPPKNSGICDFDGSRLYQRDDDTEETQKRRIEVYVEQTAPLLEYYRKKGLLVEVNGDQPINQVHKDILEIIQRAELV